MSTIVRPINLFDNVTNYDQTKTTFLGKVTTKTLAGKTVIGPPIVKYRNTITSPEVMTPAEVVLTENNRMFAIAPESNGLITIAAYTLAESNGDLGYIGKIVIQVPEPPSTGYTIRGFRVLDVGTENWKIFILFTASVAAHSGLYMVNDVDLADFIFVPPFFPTASAPSQKAVYKLDNDPFDLTDGAGIALDVINGHVYVQRGVADAHKVMYFTYTNPITTVGALGSTTELFDYQTGNLPALIGNLLLANSVELTVPASGANSGENCLIFHTTSTMYRGRISDLTDGATLWPSLEFANNFGALNNFVTQATLRATYSESLQKVILLLSSSTAPATVMIKDFANDNHDLITTILSADNNEAIEKEMYKFKTPIAPLGFDSRLGYLAIISGTTGARGIYTANFDADDVYDQTSVISPVLSIKNDQVFRFTAGFVRPELASPIKVYYRTSGFGVATGEWVAVANDLDFGGISSPSGFIQIKINFKVLYNDTSNGIQLYSAELVTRSADVISDFWEYSHKDSSPNLPSRAAFRLKKSYPSVVPTLVFRARDLDDNIYVQGNTAVNADRFEYSTDNGLNWIAVGTIPNTIGTLVRYNIEVPPGIDVRTSLRED
jgi:hypothetical protein